MSPTSYQTAPPRGVTVILPGTSAPVERRPCRPVSIGAPARSRPRLLGTYLTVVVVVDGDVVVVVDEDGGNCSMANARSAMGIDWMTKNELNESIPPAYTEYIGAQLIDHLENSQQWHRELVDAS